MAPVGYLWRRASYCLGAVLFVLTESVSASASDALLERALAAHESGSQALHSFRASVACYRMPLREVGLAFYHKDKSLIEVCRFDWVRDGDCERIKYKNYETTSDERGRPGGICDIFQDNQVRKVLDNWDWANPQNIDPVNQGSARGTIESPNPSRFGRIDPGMLTLQIPRFQINEPRATLAEYVSRFKTKSAEIIAGTPGNIRIRLAGGDSLNILGVDNVIEIDLSEPHGYQITRMAKIIPQNHFETRVFPLEFSHEVISFRDCGQGVYFPEQIVQKMIAPDQNESVTLGEIKVTLGSVNQSIDEREFDFRFPQDLQVVEDLYGEGKHKLLLWGDNNQPRAHITNGQQLLEYLTPAQRSDIPPASNGRWWMIALNLIVAIGVIAVLTRSRWQRRK